MMADKTDEILAKVKEEKVRFIDLEFTDIFGSLKSIEIPADCLKEAIEKGVWFDGSSIKGFARTKESDMYLKPDVSTYAVIPGEDDKKSARLICDVYTPDGKIFEDYPRTVLKKALDEARALGYEFKVGPEVEFYLFKKKEDGSITIPEFDSGSYFDSSAKDVGGDIRKEIMLALEKFGIESERGHHEVGAGQHEIGFKYDDALKTADRVVTLKKIIKSTAHNHGLIASFMPKPLHGKPGSGMHVHFSLFDKESKALFYDDKDNHKLSALAKQFIAGQLKHAREMCAIMNPTVSSYKRLVMGYEAPVYICWGSKDRSALVRIPRYTAGRESSARAELRCPDPSASPYLLFAAMLKAGLEGIKNNFELMPEMDDSIYDMALEELEKSGIELLPQSLKESVDAFKKSSIMKELLGEELFRKYAEAKQRESDEFRQVVTDWEVERYLEKC